MMKMQFHERTMKVIFAILTVPILLFILYLEKSHGIGGPIITISDVARHILTLLSLVGLVFLYRDRIPLILSMTILAAQLLNAVIYLAIINGQHRILAYWQWNILIDLTIYLATSACILRIIGLSTSQFAKFLPRQPKDRAGHS